MEKEGNKVMDKTSLWVGSFCRLGGSEGGHVCRAGHPCSAGDTVDGNLTTEQWPRRQSTGEFAVFQI